MPKRIRSSKKRLSILLLTFMSVLLMWSIEDYNDFNWGGHIFLIIILIAYYFAVRNIWSYQKRKKKAQHSNGILRDLKIMRDFRDYEP